MASAISVVLDPISGQVWGARLQSTAPPSSAIATPYASRTDLFWRLFGRMVARDAEKGPISSHNVAIFDGGERNRLIRFAVVGGSSTVVALAIYTVSIALGVWYPLGAALGYGAGIVNGYTWNRRWTFEAGAFHLPEFSRYVLVQGGGLVANLIGLAFAVETLGMSKLAAEIATLIPIVLVTYVFNRWWTFAPRAASRPN
jgi:putative flippase GtrA